MAKIGYICICEKDKAAGKKLHTVMPDIIFTDAVHFRGTEQTQLKQAIQHTKSGDQVFVEKLAQLGASRMDALRNISEFSNRGASLTLIAEGLTFSAHDDPMSVLVKTLLSEFKPLKGIAAKKNSAPAVSDKAKKSKPALTAKQIAELKRRANAGENKTVLARHFAISRESLLAYLR